MNTAFSVLKRFIRKETIEFETCERVINYYHQNSQANQILNHIRETIIKACIDNNYHGQIAVSDLIKELGGYIYLKTDVIKEKIVLEIGNYITTDEDFDIMQLLFNLLDNQKEYKQFVFLYGTNSYITLYVKDLISEVAREVEVQKIISLEEVEDVYELIRHLGQWIYSDTKTYEKLKNKYGK